MSLDPRCEVVLEGMSLKTSESFPNPEGNAVSGGTKPVANCCSNTFLIVAGADAELTEPNKDAHSFRISFACCSVAAGS